MTAVRDFAMVVGQQLHLAISAHGELIFSFEHQDAVAGDELVAFALYLLPPTWW